MCTLAKSRLMNLKSVIPDHTDAYINTSSTLLSLYIHIGNDNVEYADLDELETLIRNLIRKFGHSLYHKNLNRLYNLSERFDQKTNTLVKNIMSRVFTEELQKVCF